MTVFVDENGVKSFGAAPKSTREAQGHGPLHSLAHALMLPPFTSTHERAAKMENFVQHPEEKWQL